MTTSVSSRELFQFVQDGDGTSLANKLQKDNSQVNVLDETEESLLFKAVKNNEPSLAQTLINFSANLELGDESFQTTPLFEAVEKGYRDVAVLLIRSHANVNVRNQEDQTTPLHKAAETAEGKLTVEKLIEANAEIDARNSSGETPLHRAVACQNLDIAKSLVKKGANIKAQDNEGQTPLSIAASNGIDGMEVFLKGALETAKAESAQFQRRVFFTAAAAAISLLSLSFFPKSLECLTGDTEEKEPSSSFSFLYSPSTPPSLEECLSNSLRSEGEALLKSLFDKS